MLSFFSDFVSGMPDKSPQLVISRAPEIGEIYCNVLESGSVEYAQVIGLRSDKGGICHVRFELTMGYRDKVVRAGERTLSSAVFAMRFPQWLEGAPDDAEREGVAEENTAGSEVEPMMEDLPRARRA